MPCQPFTEAIQTREQNALCDIGLIKLVPHFNQHADLDSDRKPRQIPDYQMVFL
jgi:hypothetical protein